MLAERAWRVATTAFLGGLLLYVAAPMLTGRAPVRTIVVYGFSILGEVMERDLFPTFAADWHARTGEQVELVGSFAGSGTVTNQIVMGVPAEVAMLSRELDAERLAQAGVTASGSWRSLPYQGVLVRTPIVIVVRPGNPRKIRGFADLEGPGVRIVHPDPTTSGGAAWAILAEFGSAARDLGEDADPKRVEAAGRERLTAIWGNVVAQAASARAARTQFENGFGDVLITYEQDVIDDIRQGRLQAEIVYPRGTVFSELTVVAVERNVPTADRAVVGAFVEWLWTPAAQSRLVGRGFRSVLEGLNAANPAFGRLDHPFRVSDMGGWTVVQRDIITGAWRRDVRGETGP